MRACTLLGAEWHICFAFVLQKTLSPSIPPRPPERPTLPTRYPIIPTRKLLDISDAPKPPPRAHAPGNSNTFVSHITKNEVNGHSVFHTNPIHFTEVGKDSTKLKLSTSTDQRKLSWSSSMNPILPSMRNGSKLASATLSMPCSTVKRPVPLSSNAGRSTVPATLVPLENGPSLEVILTCMFILISIMYFIFERHLMSWRNKGFTNSLSCNF